ncbi:hypothetical protein [Haliscomenobacter hydrossis]|uniref:Uncharacterized protein n=1 Tax=Haliscomenobacter hydrossis (strain ATCC 27775 / DSM 1100 / LMG 10767 / O) TaxID=760192 RepID=F4L852_HALH1|nr:hypothetical protein [Haliscomenobacter hydrossis]AEE54560.1 hypothetical protein Halhy_6746 [Haliscomenobacter hydrossis DSM 1100]
MNTILFLLLHLLLSSNQTSITASTTSTPTPSTAESSGRTKIGSLDLTLSRIGP